ncbi:MAG: nickel-dependent lactate racemase, partial [Candidatus Eisenbacteria bacterium]|nr:nickel-dependent lactate racemase [Candidatus Eisenbacteria bacterium]
MRIAVPYGSGEQSADIPDRCETTVVRPSPPADADEEGVLAEALGRPLGAPTLEAFLEGADELVIVVNDATRATPTARLLRMVHPAVSRVESPTVIVAAGTHRAPTEEELRMILGDLHGFYRDRTLVHDARDRSAMAAVGTTSRGNEVLLNRRVVHAERVLVLGSVEPHYFAGYTGGRKSLLPGVAAYETVERNHALAMDPAAAPTALEGNPVHEEMEEAAALVRGHRVWSVMTVVDADGDVFFAAAGGLRESFEAAVGGARDVFEAPVDRPADVVVAVAPPPMDGSLYQAHKALEHGNLALREGGTIVLVSECPEGVGQTSFADLLSAASTPEEAVRA